MERRVYNKHNEKYRRPDVFIKDFMGSELVIELQHSYLTENVLEGRHSDHAKAGRPILWLVTHKDRETITMQSLRYNQSSDRNVFIFDEPDVEESYRRKTLCFRVSFERYIPSFRDDHPVLSPVIKRYAINDLIVENNTVKLRPALVPYCPSFAEVENYIKAAL